MSQKSVEDARFPHDVLARIARHAAKVPVLAVFGICAASASPADARSCPPVAWRLPTPPAQLASGVPPSGMLSALGVFRRAQIPADTAGVNWRAESESGLVPLTGAISTIDSSYIRRLGIDSEGGSVYLLAGTIRRAPSVSKRCLARLPARTKLRLLHLQREDRTRGPVLIYDEVQPGFGSAFHAYSLTDLQAGDITTAGVGGGSPTNPNEDAWGLVPDSVASVSVLVEHRGEVVADVTNNFWFAPTPGAYVAVNSPVVVWRSATGAPIKRYSILPRLPSVVGSAPATRHRARKAAIPDRSSARR